MRVRGLQFSARHHCLTHPYHEARGPSVYPVYRAGRDAASTLWYSPAFPKGRRRSIKMRLTICSFTSRRIGSHLSIVRRNSPRNLSLSTWRPSTLRSSPSPKVTIVPSGWVVKKLTVILRSGRIAARSRPTLSKRSSRAPARASWTAPSLKVKPSRVVVAQEPPSLSSNFRRISRWLLHALHEGIAPGVGGEAMDVIADGAHPLHLFLRHRSQFERFEVCLHLLG
jgi:hypothetical protein